MNYEEMSDFEINKAVSGKFRKVWTWGGEVFLSMASTKPFDPCNNPSDAWPIIVENEITVAKTKSFDEWEAYGGGYEVNYDHEIESCMGSEFMDKNPLRAAMICFLKMKSI